MSRILWSRATLICFGLMLATGLSWTLGHGLGFGGSPYAGGAVLAIAVLKGRYVVLDFMELRHAPLPMRLAAEAWGVLLGITLISLFLGV